MQRTLACALAMLSLTAAAPNASNPLSRLNFLVGTWTCSFQAGAMRAQYTATFSYVMGNAWLQQIDSWKGGGGDSGMYSYLRDRRQFSEVVMEDTGHTTIFVHDAVGPTAILYKTVYPNAGATERFEQVSPQKYTLQFTGTLNGKTMSSLDVCTKKS